MRIGKKELDFELYKSYQPGLYEYDLWIGKIDSGTVFLEVYEITQNDKLPKDRLTKKNSIRVGNLTDEIERFVTDDHFTIYKDDWGKPYAERSEVWYNPDNGKEKMIIEKNYIIEGWQH